MIGMVALTLGGMYGLHRLLQPKKKTRTRGRELPISGQFIRFVGGQWTDRAQVMLPTFDVWRSGLTGKWEGATLTFGADSYRLEFADFGDRYAFAEAMISFLETADDAGVKPSDGLVLGFGDGEEPVATATIKPDGAAWRWWFTSKRGQLNKAASSRIDAALAAIQYAKRTGR